MDDPSGTVLYIYIYIYNFPPLLDLFTPDPAPHTVRADQLKSEVALPLHRGGGGFRWRGSHPRPRDAGDTSGEPKASSVDEEPVDIGNDVYAHTVFRAHADWVIDVVA